MDLTHVDLLLPRLVLIAHIILRAEEVQQIFLWNKVAVAVCVVHPQLIVMDPVHHGVFAVIGDTGNVLDGQQVFLFFQKAAVIRP